MHLEPPWYFLWGLCGVRTILSFRKLERALETETFEDSPAVLAAREQYSANQFSCLYGRRGNARLRKLVDIANHLGIASKKELCSLVRYGDLYSTKDGNVHIRNPILSAFHSSIVIYISGYCIFFAATMIILAPIILVAKLPLLLLLFLLYSNFTIPFYASPYHPCAILYRIGDSLKVLDERLVISSHHDKLRVVK